MIVLLALPSTETRLNTHSLARVNTVEGDLMEEHLVMVLLALSSTETRLNTHSQARVNTVEGDLVEVANPEEPGPGGCEGDPPVKPC